MQNKVNVNSCRLVLAYVRRGAAPSPEVKLASAGAHIWAKGCVCYHRGFWITWNEVSCNPHWVQPSAVENTQICKVLTWFLQTEKHYPESSIQFSVVQANIHIIFHPKHQELPCCHYCFFLVPWSIYCPGSCRAHQSWFSKQIYTWFCCNSVDMVTWCKYICTRDVCL